MDIVDPASAALCNYEVLQLVIESTAQLKKQGEADAEPSVENLNTITYELRRYLGATPAASQSKAVVVDFLAKLAKYPLSRFEKLQLLNFRPCSEVLFLRLVEGGEERFTSETIAEILELVETTLPAPPAEPVEDGAAPRSAAQGGAGEGDGGGAGQGDGDDDAMEEDEDHPADDLVNERDTVSSEGEDNE